MPDVGPAAKFGERPDVAPRTVRPKVAMLTALDTAMFVFADDVAVVFVQEADDCIGLGFPVNRPKSVHEVVSRVLVPDV